MSEIIRKVQLICLHDDPHIKVLNPALEYKDCGGIKYKIEEIYYTPMDTNEIEICLFLNKDDRKYIKKIIYSGKYTAFIEIKNCESIEDWMNKNL